MMSDSGISNNLHHSSEDIFLVVGRLRIESLILSSFDSLLHDLDNMRVVVDGGVVHWRVVPSVSDIQIDEEVLLEEELDDVELAVRARNVHRSSLVIVSLGHVVVAADRILHHLLHNLLHSDQVALASGLQELIVQIFDVRRDKWIGLNRELVEVESGCNSLAELHSSNRVTVLVESWRIGTEAHHARNHSDDGAAYSGLGWNSNREGKLTAEVVHSTAEHDGKGVSYNSWRKNLVSSQGTDAVVGEGSGYDGHSVGIRLKTAKHEVEVEGGVDVAGVLKSTVRLHEASEGSVGPRLASLRQVDLVVVLERLASRHSLPLVEDERESGRLSQVRSNQRGNHDGSGVDARVVWAAVFIHNQGVESDT